MQQQTTHRYYHTHGRGPQQPSRLSHLLIIFDFEHRKQKLLISLHLNFPFQQIPTSMIASRIFLLLLAASMASAKGTKGGSKDNSKVGSSGSGLVERFQCMSWDDPRTVAAARITTSSCSSNSCSGGCCRVS